jgi:hypothetical protein
MLAGAGVGQKHGWYQQRIVTFERECARPIPELQRKKADAIGVASAS